VVGVAVVVVVGVGVEVAVSSSSTLGTRDGAGSRAIARSNSAWLLLVSSAVAEGLHPGLFGFALRREHLSCVVRELPVRSVDLLDRAAQVIARFDDGAVKSITGPEGSWPLRHGPRTLARHPAVLHTSPMIEAVPAHGSTTWDDFVALEEDDRRELIDGELLEVEVPTKVHEYVVWLIGGFFAQWARPRAAGFGLVSGFKVRISDRRGVMPDFQFFQTGNLAASGDSAALEDGRPDLAVEVISPGSARYDRVVKLEYYASIGVPEYWIVDLPARALERLVLQQGGRYLIAQTGRDEDVFRPESFEGMEIPLGELWTLPVERR
jgi:Uma2 family endonuclease